ncbi:MAG: DUF177 domain-containing protein [Armatimonadota bacterium]
MEFTGDGPPGSGAVFAAPIELSLELVNLDLGIAVRGHLSVPLKQACSRCLGVFEQILEIAVNEDCALKQIDAPESYAVDDDDLCQIPLLNGDELDLSELVRQLIAMHLPTRPLCREECPGLCLHCGRDLAAGPCNCLDEQTDPRWAGLTNLKLD